MGRLLAAALLAAALALTAAADCGRLSPAQVLEDWDQLQQGCFALSERTGRGETVPETEADGLCSCRKVERVSLDLQSLQDNRCPDPTGMVSYGGFITGLAQIRSTGRCAAS